MMGALTVQPIFCGPVCDTGHESDDETAEHRGQDDSAHTAPRSSVAMNAAPTTNPIKKQPNIEAATAAA